MKIVALSDTHNRHNTISVPDGDVLIHAGDATTYGKFGEINLFARWMRKLPHKYKIFTAGNHDFLVQYQELLARGLMEGIIVLIDQSIEIDGVVFHGTPWVKKFGNWAFMASEDLLSTYYDKVPLSTDVLISHGPPYGILDLTLDKERAGSQALREVVSHIRPRYHIFGHIHEGYGYKEGPYTNYYNVAICNRAMKAVNKPVEILLSSNGRTPA